VELVLSPTKQIFVVIRGVQHKACRFAFVIPVCNNNAGRHLLLYFAAVQKKSMLLLLKSDLPPTVRTINTAASLSHTCDKSVLSAVSM
jgi:hypothetical protein